MAPCTVYMLPKYCLCPVPCALHQSYTAFMSQCVDQLADSLERPCQAGQAVDIWRELGKMTLQVGASYLAGRVPHTLQGGCLIPCRVGASYLAGWVPHTLQGGCTRGWVGGWASR